MYGSVEIPQNRATQGHVLYYTLHSANSYGVSNVVLVFRQDEETVDKVLDQSLCAEPNGQARHARTGQQRPHVDAQEREDLHPGNGNDRKKANAVGNAGERPELLGTQRRLLNV